MVCKAVRRAAVFVLFAGLLTVKNASAQGTGLELTLDRDITFLADNDYFGQLTCRAAGNDVTLESVTLIWVKATEESTDLVTVTKDSPQDGVDHNGILGNGTLENNSGHIVLDRLDEDVCDYSSFLCEVTFTKESGEKERVIAAAWPRTPESVQSGPDNVSNSTEALADVEKRLADMSAALEMLNKTYSNLLEGSQEQRKVNANFSAKISELESKLSSSTDGNPSCDPCSNVTQALDDLERRLEDLEKSNSPPSGCYRGMATNTNETHIYLTLDSIGKQVRCDAQTDGGGWIVFQRRETGDVNFFRDWDTYKEGFGNLTGDYWLGNEAIYKLTSEAEYELRIEFAGEGNYYFVHYSTFRLEDESDMYRLRLGPAIGGLFVEDDEGLSYSNNTAFSTSDRDNDVGDGNCAVLWRAAWWYRACYRAHFNGNWEGDDYDRVLYMYSGGIVQLDFTEMKIRQI